MQATRRLFQHRQPMIHFLGRRGNAPASAQTEHPPKVHPASPIDELPDSFAKYRQRAQQYGPLASSSSSKTSNASSRQARSSGKSFGELTGEELGSPEPKKGQFWDRNDLPPRFHRMTWTQADIEAIESGGATLYE
ncbi:hypothetical protein K470DRAFT_279908 [Piedraia hortae CBS 480.64]|uniref:Ribosomal protein S36, mitochondrial n=1 Tax=Piedraia hortae CBS 480.64 TaxID=1314780 RepID=A0A6A7CA21_9PEZI|nr:hypothetical protein K470DRAFT_279908 [Piedraia hortae CBS 480.64]